MHRTSTLRSSVWAAACVLLATQAWQDDFVLLLEVWEGGTEPMIQISRVGNGNLRIGNGRSLLLLYLILLMVNVEFVLGVSKPTSASSSWVLTRRDPITD